MNVPRWLLALEALILFAVLPAVLAQDGFHRPTLYITLWGCCIYGFATLVYSSQWNWHALWQGAGWNRRQIREAAGRFCLATGLALILLATAAPDRLFDFPRRNPQMWAMVMVFYPLLSVVPQEFIYRCFFFRRYAVLFPNPTSLIIANALCFAAMHFVLQNWVAPLLSLIGGVIFAYGYQQHRSLKWAALEHALYGCMIFTVGLGWFFFRGLAPPP